MNINEKAIEMFEQNKYEEAMELFQQAVHESRDVQSLNNPLGCTFMRKRMMIKLLN